MAVLPGPSKRPPVALNPSSVWNDQQWQWREGKGPLSQVKWQSILKIPFVMWICLQVPLNQTFIWSVEVQVRVTGSSPPSDHFPGLWPLCLAAGPPNLSAAKLVSCEPDTERARPTSLSLSSRVLYSDEPFCINDVFAYEPFLVILTFLPSGPFVSSCLMMLVYLRDFYDVVFVFVKVSAETPFSNLSSFSALGPFFSAHGFNMSLSWVF